MTEIFARAQKDVLVAAHRGVSGGNIPCNTLAAYEIALRQGAQIIELDVSRSADGCLYAFHPGMEPAHLRSARQIREMTSAQVDALRFVNQDDTPTQFPVNRLEEVLDALNGRCFINVDKFWTAPAEIAALIRARGMADQVIIKTAAGEQAFRDVETYAPDMNYMAIFSERDDWTDVLRRRQIRYVGAEVTFAADDAPVAQAEYLQQMRAAGLIVWVNSLVYDYRVRLCGEHGDDVAMTQDRDAGWGWLVDQGFSIIQTDWLMELRAYLSARGC